MNLLALRHGPRLARAADLPGSRLRHNHLADRRALCVARPPPARPGRGEPLAARRSRAAGGASAKHCHSSLTMRGSTTSRGTLGWRTTWRRDSTSRLRGEGPAKQSPRWSAFSSPTSSLAGSCRARPSPRGGGAARAFRSGLTQRRRSWRCASPCAGKGGLRRSACVRLYPSLHSFSSHTSRVPCRGKRLHNLELCDDP